VPVTNVEKDPKALTMTITSEFGAPVERSWQLWADPRQLERWWGPPSYPATFVAHDLKLGGIATYFMTGPDGDRSHGWWRVVHVDPPRSLEFEDGFGDDPDHAPPELPVTRMRVLLEERPGGGTRMSIETAFPSLEAMEQMLSMGIEDGMREALNQIDAIVSGADTPG
jgi:uncharacterized protein YndB with AHSA1/START domain